VPPLGGDTPIGFRLSRDERTAFYAVTNDETDIWLVTMTVR
jgi:hypothetical protein